MYRLLSILVLLLLCSFTVTASAQQAAKLPTLPVKGYILQDFHSGRVLVEQNSEQRMEPASITKLMSAYIIYQQLQKGQLQLDERVNISERAWRVEGSRMFVEVGSRVSVDELLKGIVIQSGNDATIAMAEHIAGSEAGFAVLMNKQAQELGLKDSHFVNSTGLPHPEHYTTPKDIARLSQALIANFPDYYASYAVRSFTYNNIEQHNRNKLLWSDESVDGIKTGHTKAAGYCLAASAKRGNMRLITVVLGAEKRAQRFSATEDLLNYGFRNFQTHRLYQAGHVLTKARVWKGAEGNVPLGFAKDVYITIRRNRYADMQASLRVNSAIEAPVAQGAHFGGVTIRLDDQIVADIPLEALTGIPEGGMASRLTDEVLLLFYSLFN